MSLQAHAWLRPRWNSTKYAAGRRNEYANSSNGKRETAATVKAQVWRFSFSGPRRNRLLWSASSGREWGNPGFRRYFHSLGHRWARVHCSGDSSSDERPGEAEKRGEKQEIIHSHASSFAPTSHNGPHMRQRVRATQIQSGAGHPGMCGLT